jgi:hypothetical protein
MCLCSDPATESAAPSGAPTSDANKVTGSAVATALPVDFVVTGVCGWLLLCTPASGIAAVPECAHCAALYGTPCGLHSLPGWCMDKCPDCSPPQTLSPPAQHAPLSRPRFHHSCMYWLVLFLVYYLRVALSAWRRPRGAAVGGCCVCGARGCQLPAHAWLGGKSNPVPAPPRRPTVAWSPPPHAPPPTRDVAGWCGTRVCNRPAGFGRFGGVDVNPTTELVAGIQAAASSGAITDGARNAAPLASDAAVHACVARC